MKIYQGIAGSDGVAVGPVKIRLDSTVNIDGPVHVCAGETEAQLQKLEDSIIAVRREITDLAKKAKSKVGEQAAEIFEAQLMILEDPEIIDKIREKISTEQMSTAYALQQVIDSVCCELGSLEDEYMRARASDIRDVGNRLQLSFSGCQVPNQESVDPYIFVAADVTPSDTMSLDTSKIQAIVSEKGSKTSHAVILARSMGIPAVVGVTGILSRLKNGETVIVNGQDGTVIAEPTPEQIQETLGQNRKAQSKRDWVVHRAGLTAKTLDGVDVTVEGNIGSPDDVNNVLTNGGDGIGLFRSEFFYMNRGDFPSEEEQFEAYRKVAEALNGKTAVIRTMDIGGDKHLSYLQLPEEANPFLGYRALRISLHKREVFKPQLRAILRASSFGSLAIMFPMVSCVEEIRAAKGILEQCKQELREEGASFDETIKSGIMVEIPSIAMQAEVAAKEVDFFSIGTNDLLQYTLAVDRMNEKVSYLYNPYHPGVLLLIRHVLSSAQKAGIPAAMCGEMAGDLQATPILLGLGLHCFSMNAHSIPFVKDRIRTLSFETCSRLAESAIKAATSEEVRNLFALPSEVE
jgi:phosphoenolpyruvate-protein phosphotransferase (PTS system enzyme I)